MRSTDFARFKEAVLKLKDSKESGFLFSNYLFNACTAKQLEALESAFDAAGYELWYDGIRWGYATKKGG